MTDQPTERDLANVALREHLATKQNAEYSEALRLAIGALGPGWKPWMKISAIPADHRETGIATPAAVCFKVYRGDEKLSENALFIRKRPDGSVQTGKTVEELFGDLLTEKHPTKTMEIKCERVPVGRYELQWSTMEVYRPRDAEQLAALRTSRERGKAEREERKFQEENPLLAWAERVKGEADRQR